jgi:type III secretion system (T3SS) SseB-like protein
MLARIRSWLTAAPGPLRLARERGDEEFATVFVTTDFWLFSLPAEFQDGIPSSVPQEEALAFIERAAQDLAERESFEPFAYRAPNGNRVLPLFTDERAAQTFLQSYVNEVRRIVPFQGVSIKGAALAGSLGNYDVVLVNPRTADELLVSPGEVRSIVAKGA